MTFQTFLETLEKRKGSAKARELRDEWIAAVNRLIDQLCHWLAESDPRKVLEPKALETDKYEPGLGSYTIRMLVIGGADTEIQVMPVGRNAVGIVSPPGEAALKADGRVDITDGVQKYILYRTLRDGHEVWYALDERFQAAPLDRTRFEAILQDLLS